MKKIVVNSILILCLFFNISCSSTYNYNRFYNAHKNDMNSTAFQLPKFLTNILSGMSPEMNSLFSNLNDFKFLTISNIDSQSLEEINLQANSITNESFTDFLRNTQENSRLIISGKEFDGIVKELVYFKIQDNTLNSFYLKGFFDSNKIKQLSEKGEFDTFTTELLNYSPTSIIPNSIQ